jgi:2-haloalkanoic acid dehalogenase type II
LNSFDIDRFEAVVFDLDSTLTDTHRYPLHASYWLLRESGVTSDDTAYEYLGNLVARYRMAIQSIAEGAPYRSPFEIVQEAMGSSLVDIEFDNNPVLVEEATRIFKQLHVELSTVYPGVQDVLSRIQSRSIKMGVLSNSFEGHAEIILEKLGLREYFAAVVDCGSVNSYKPMSQPFEKVLEILGVAASKVLYVGDEYYADIAGASAVGMGTVWINNRDSSLEDLVFKYGAESSPDFVLQSVSDLLNMIPSKE